MKTLERLNNNDREYSPFFIEKNDIDINLVYWQEVNDMLVLQFNIDMYSEDSYRIFLNDQVLSLIISEVKEVTKPYHVHNIDWDEVNTNGYEVMKNVDFWLPGGNFYLLRHFFVPRNKMLHIYLGKLHYN